MGTAVSEEFIVEVGEVFQLGAVTQPETASGGTVFGSQPVVGVQDRGGNIASVALQNGPIGSALRCTDEDGFSVPFTDGLAPFHDFLSTRLERNIPFGFQRICCLKGEPKKNLAYFL
ncbi:hypothetical protein ACHAXH_007860 [Discostella pseudostelligera]